MKFEDFKKIVTVLYTEHVNSEKILEEYPYTYIVSIVNSSYFDSKIAVYEKILEDYLTLLFGQAIYECVMWFLYDWEPGFSVTVDGKEFIINNLDEYLNFKKITENWEDL